MERSETLELEVQKNQELSNARNIMSYYGFHLFHQVTENPFSEEMMNIFTIWQNDETNKEFKYFSLNYSWYMSENDYINVVFIKDYSVPSQDFELMKKELTILMNVAQLFNRKIAEYRDR